MADGQIGYGFKVRVGVGEAPAWTALQLVGDIDMPDEQVDEIDVTHQDSPGRRRQFIAGLIDGGEVSIPMNYIPGNATDTVLLAIKASGEEVQLELTLPPTTAGGTGQTETYAAFLKSYARSAPIADKMTATATFRLSAQIVEEEGGGA
ncbi:phage tail tube protein [Pikeienuella sp. HZG-20]|uniref:phage tail tube protein n=1 Tax=Paludibacillus litoralis TaxID=3133267 RepID=UPI0030ED07C5